MVLKPGYKKTEAGLIPENWEVSSVGREFEIKLGKMLDAEKNMGVPKPYLGNKSVQWGRIDITDLPYVRMSCSDIERFRLKKGDLLVCEGGEVGRAAIWNAPLKECYYQKALHRLRPLRGFDSQLMAALLKQWSDRGMLANFVTQTSIAHLPREKFMEVPMPVPPAPEQRAIAEALGDMDALLGALDRLIAKKCDLNQAAMRRLLTGQTRLPGFQDKWEVKPLASICVMKSGEAITSAEMDDSSKYPCYGGNGLRGFVDRFTHVGGYALIGRQGALCGNVLGVEGTFFASEHAVVVTATPRTDIRWLTCVLGEMRLNQYSESSAQPGLSVAKLLNLDVAVPASKLEQTAIAKVLSDMDAELSALEQRRKKTRDLKQAMMQELLTGRTRLV